VAAIDRRRIHVYPDADGVHADACQSTNVGCGRENFDPSGGNQHGTVYSGTRANLQCRSAGPATVQEDRSCRQAHR